MPFLFAELYPSFDLSGQEILGLITGTLNYNNCNGEYVRTNCSLVAATIEYDVIVEDHAIAFATSASSGRVDASCAKALGLSPSTFCVMRVKVAFGAMTSLTDGRENMASARWAGFGCAANALQCSRSK